jgi:hypothetical protein
LDFVGSFKKPQTRVDGDEHHFTLGFHEADNRKPVISDFHILSNDWLGSKEQCWPGSSL